MSYLEAVCVNFKDSIFRFALQRASLSVT